MQNAVTPGTEMKGSHTFATNRYAILDHFHQLITVQVNYFCLNDKTVNRGLCTRYICFLRNVNVSVLSKYLLQFLCVTAHESLAFSRHACTSIVCRPKVSTHTTSLVCFFVHDLKDPKVKIETKTTRRNQT